MDQYWDCQNLGHIPFLILLTNVSFDEAFLARLLHNKVLSRKQVKALKVIFVVLGHIGIIIMPAGSGGRP